MKIQQYKLEFFRESVLYNLGTSGFVFNKEELMNDLNPITDERTLLKLAKYSARSKTFEEFPVRSKHTCVEEKIQILDELAGFADKFSPEGVEETIRIANRHEKENRKDVDQKIKFFGIPSGDGESFCFKVDKETFAKVTVYVEEEVDEKK